MQLVWIPGGLLRVLLHPFLQTHQLKLNPCAPSTPSGQYAPSYVLIHMNPSQLSTIKCISIVSNVNKHSLQPGN